MEQAVKDAEQRIEKLEEQIATMEAQLATPEGAADAALFVKYGELKSALSEAEDEWAAAIEAVEAFG